MPNAKPTCVEQCREYLRLLARMQLSPDLAGKIDLSGVVQQTLWEAASADRPAGNGSEQRVWMRHLLSNNLRDAIRKATAARRDVRRERSLEAAIEASSARIEAWLVSQQSSPSKRAIRGEELELLAAALVNLSEDQRLAIELHHFEGLSLSAVSQRLGRSKEAVASLLYRAIKHLRNELVASGGG
jgi:RNA polymerase sigma-70 factor (ECF subfamily)